MMLEGALFYSSKLPDIHVARGVFLDERTQDGEALQAFGKAAAFRAQDFRCPQFLGFARSTVRRHLQSKSVRGGIWDLVRVAAFEQLLPRGTA